MPNWCNNTVTITHRDSEMLECIANADPKNLFAAFFPCPKDLRDTVAGSYADAEEQNLLRIRERANEAKYGCKNWFDWCIAHWGTKWDACNATITRRENSFILTFETAWGPPIMWYNSMLELGYEIVAYYCETGMGFCGKYDNGTDDYYEFDSADAIPAEIVKEYPFLDNKHQ